MLKLFFFCNIILVLSIPIYAETLRLNSGESLEGKIQKMDENTLYIESNLTAQELKIDRANLNLIEFDNSERSLARRIGIGFHYRPKDNTETISFKNWLGTADSAGLMIGYTSGMENNFSIELRYTRVFKIEGTNDIFDGAGTGIVSKDNKKETLLRFSLSQPKSAYM